MDIVETGRGGMMALRKCLEEQFESGIGLGVFRVTAVDDRGVTVSLRTKLVLVIYLGPKVPMMKRAKLVSHNGAFNSQFTTNLQMQVDDLSDLSEENLERKLRAIGGAHQPTSFDFVNDSDSKAD